MRQHQADLWVLTLATEVVSPVSARDVKAGVDATESLIRRGDDALDSGIDIARRTCSFHGDTLVQTAEGLVPISQIVPGTLVWSRDPATGQMGWKRVLAQYSNPYDETVYVTIRDAETGMQQVIISNRIHPFFVQRGMMSGAQSISQQVQPSSEGHVYRGPIPNGFWIDAADLQAGDRLLNADQSWAVVVGVQNSTEALTAFNLTVEDFSTYFVASTETAHTVWVHNNCQFDSIFNVNRLPQARQDAVNDTLSNINSGQRPSWLPSNRRNKWGSEFHNSRGDLPTRDGNGNAITYREYDVQNTTGAPGAGSDRIVTGSDGRTYFTGTHYGDNPGKPFVRIE